MRYLFLLSLSFQSLFAQNLVVNGGFERTPTDSNFAKPLLSPCSFSSYSVTFNKHVQGWHTYNMLTPDLFVIDTAVTSYLQLPAPHKGIRMIGLIMYLPGTDTDHEYDYHEYVEGRLAQTLVPGKQYQVSFWVHEAKEIGRKHLQQISQKSVQVEAVNCGNFGFYFSTEPSSDAEDIRRSIFEYSIKPQVVFTEVVQTNKGWRKMLATFTPDRPFKYFIFGNFGSDGTTPNDMSDEQHRAFDALNALQPSHSLRNKRIGYYCFDDFAVIANTTNLPLESAVNKPKTSADIEKKLLSRQKVSFEATLLFETDQYVLQQSAFEHLNQLVAALQTQTDIRIEISGHTDDTGSIEYNATLSERRAAAVQSYLVQRGIAIGRLVAKGYGEQQPLVPNNTVEGRSANRRVECISL
jgi:outer membrane protein OmpA-like peptidoglycan-associated protein